MAARGGPTARAPRPRPVACRHSSMSTASCHLSTCPMLSGIPQGGGRPCPGPPSLTRARVSGRNSRLSGDRLLRRQLISFAVVVHSAGDVRHALPLRMQGRGRVMAVTTDVVGRLRGDHALRPAVPAVFSSSQPGRAGAFGRSGSGSVHSFPQAAKAASTGTKARPCSVRRYSKRAGLRLYCVRLRTPEAVSSVSRRASVFSLIRNRSRNSSNRRAPARASRTTRSAHRSPTTSGFAARRRPTGRPSAVDDRPQATR